MASVRIRTRKDGSIYYAVLYRHAGKQTSTSFPDEKQARRFRELLGAVGTTRAMEVAGIADTNPARHVFADGCGVPRTAHRQPDGSREEDRRRVPAVSTE